MNTGSPFRAWGALGILMVLVTAGCQVGTAAVVAPTSPAQPAPAVTLVPSASAGGASAKPGGRWVPAGRPMAGCCGAAVPLADGGALAIGDGTTVQRWDRATATWHKVAALNAPRGYFVAVPLRDGHILVTGGLDTHDWNRWQAYSSTYVYDPSTPTGSWTKVGLLGMARVAPAAAVLRDGRVLVAGGAYKDGPPYPGTGSVGISLASATSIAPGPGAGSGGRLDDVAPPSIGVALATAELFDPATGRWSPTGSMRFARAGAAAVTLSDGRVLVVGPSSYGDGMSWAQMDPRVFGTAEVYDPATGRFSLVGSLPPIDRAALAAAGVAVPTSDPDESQIGTLVALPDGGALLVGHDDEWKHAGAVTRTFRFDPRSGRWRQVGRAWAGFWDWSVQRAWHQTPGVDLAGAFAAALPDGRVLIAGGCTYPSSQRYENKQCQPSSVARLYNPVTNAWSNLPSMPAGGGGDAVPLADGSVLLIGGAETTIRFVPSR